MKDDERDYTGVLIEDLHSKMDAVLEIVIASRKETKAEFAEFRREVREETQLLRQVIKEQGVHISDHEERITDLETQIA